MLKNIRHFQISKRIALLFVCSTICVSACNQTEQPPVSQEEMAAIMTEVHLAEAYAGLMHKASDKAPEKNLDSLGYYYKRILSKHQLSTKSFDSAVQWYRFHPAQMDSVYAKIVAHFDSLQAMK
jgi:AMMECR1 domain-containing protein